MGAHRNVSESIGWQKPVPRSKFRCVIIKIGTCCGFGRLPCESGLARARLFRPRTRPPRSFENVRQLLAQPLDPPAAETGMLCDFLPQSTDRIRLRQYMARVSHRIPCRLAGGCSCGWIGRSRLHHHSGIKRAGSRRRAAARMGSGNGGRRRLARRWIRVLDRTPRQAADPRRLAHEPLSGGGGEERGVLSPMGTWAVFFARFVPPVRAFVPITAGALGMAPFRFYAVNIPAILLWAPAHVLPGVVAVSALHEYAGIARHTGIGKHYWILLVIGGALITSLAVWLVRRRHAAVTGHGESSG